MSSTRIFELAHVIHLRLSTEGESGRMPFGGKLLVIVGEILQLRPFPYLFDVVENV